MLDLILKNGEVIDPSRGLRGRLDVGISGGMVSRLDPAIDPDGALRVIDVSGKLVVPGLIDLHTHVYEGVFQVGVNPDLVGVRAGVTTVVDAGSAGCDTFGGIPRYVVPQAKTRIYCLLHIGKTGIITQPDIAGRDSIDVDGTLRVIQANRALVKGVKIRAMGPAVPTLGVEMVRLAKRAAIEAGLPLMVHIGDADAGDGPTLTRQLLPLLDEGDIVTHLFTPNPGKVVGVDGRVIPELSEAHSRGVHLDTAHGRYNFSFDVAKRVLDQGITPSTISTDITIPGRRDTVHSMTEMLSRFLALGFSLEQVVGMATINPARALGVGDTLGTLAAGRVADITVLEEVTGDWLFRDTAGGTLKGDKALVPTLTVKGGEVFAPEWGPRPWGWLPESASS